MNSKISQTSWFCMPHIFTQCRSVKKIEQLAAIQRNARNMRRVYEIAAPYIECEIVDNNAESLNFKLYITPHNMIIVEEKISKLTVTFLDLLMDSD